MFFVFGSTEVFYPQRKQLMERKKEIYDMIQAARNDGVSQDEVAELLLNDYNISASNFQIMLKNKASFDKRNGEMREKRMGLHKQDLGMI